MTSAHQPSSLDGIKRLAKSIKAERGVTHTFALVEAAKRAGFNNYTHAQRHLAARSRRELGFEIQTRLNRVDVVANDCGYVPLAPATLAKARTLEHDLPFSLAPRRPMQAGTYFSIRPLSMIRASLLTVLLASNLGTVAQTANTDERIKEINDLAVVAASICVQVAQEGSLTSDSFNASVQAGLSKVLKKYSPFDADIKIQKKIDSYKGVLREHLAAALNDVRACQSDFMKQMVPLIIPSPTPPGPPEPTEAEMQHAVEAIASNINDGQKSLAAKCQHGDFNNDQALAWQCLQKVITGTMHVAITNIHKLSCDRASGASGYICDYDSVVGFGTDNPSINTESFTQGTRCKGRFVLTAEKTWVLGERECH